MVHEKARQGAGRNDRHLEEGWCICGKEKLGVRVMLVIQERSKPYKAIVQLGT